MGIFKKKISPEELRTKLALSGKRLEKRELGVNCSLSSVSSFPSVPSCRLEESRPMPADSFCHGDRSTVRNQPNSSVSFPPDIPA